MKASDLSASSQQPASSQEQAGSLDAASVGSKACGEAHRLQTAVSAVSGSFNSPCEVTSEMVSAGVFVLQFADSYPEEDLVTLIYQQMQGVAFASQKSPHDYQIQGLQEDGSSERFL